MTEDEAVEALVRGFDAWWMAEARHRYEDACCILATRLGMAVMQHYSVEAWAWPTNTLVFNRAAHDLVTAGIPTSDWPDHAWSIGTNLEDDPTHKRWGGHLWLRTSGWAIDLSHRQFNRPGLIRAHHAIAVPLDRHRNELVAWIDPNIAVYAVPIRSLSWRQSNDWQRNWREVVDDLLGYVEGVAA